MIQLICRFSQPGDNFWTRARAATALLSAQPTCLGVRMARSTEDPAVWILSAGFRSFAGYRAALGPFDVRTTVIPFLSEADQELSGVLEVLLEALDGVLIETVPTVGPAVEGDEAQG